MNEATIVYRHASQLGIHPIAATQPMLPDNAPEMVALTESMRTYGQERQPLLINANDQIMDGRHRFVGGKKAGLQEFACIVRPDEEAAALVVESLSARRHYTKGARAYLAFSLMEEAASANKIARISQIKAGATSRNSTQRTFGNFGPGVEDLADQLGFGKSSYFQAKAVHKEFDQADTALLKWRAANPEKAAMLDGGTHVTEAPPDLRAQFEPAILCGDVGLGGALQAIAGVKATRGKAKNVRPEIQLLMRGIDTLSLRLGRAWGTLPQAEQEHALQHMGKTLAESLPEDARKQLMGLLAGGKQKAQKRVSHLATLTIFAFQKGDKPTVKPFDHADQIEAMGSPSVAWVCPIETASGGYWEAEQTAAEDFRLGRGSLTHAAVNRGLNFPTAAAAA